MRFLLLLPLLAAVVSARPQTSATSSDWKPIETESQSQRLRYNSQLREFPNYFRNFIPVNFQTHPASNHYRNNGNVITWHTDKMLNSLGEPRRKLQIKYKIANITSMKEQANKNKNKRKPSISIIKRPNKINNNNNNTLNNKHWPDTEIQTFEDLHNYQKYVTSTRSPPVKKQKPKPVTQHIVTKVSENLPSNNKNNKWHEIKLKPPFKQTTDSPIHSIPSSVPIEITENSNPFPVKIPHTNNVINVNSSPINLPDLSSSDIPSNNVHIGTTVLLTPEPEDDDETNSETRPANNANNPCPAVSITTNTIYNKEVCPDLDIVINNHIQTNTNLFTDSPVLDDSDFVPVDYEPSPSDLDPEEVDYPEDEDGEFESEESEPEIEPSIEEQDEEPLLEDGLGESASSSGTDTSSDSGSNNRPQLPNLPGLPQNDNNNNNQNENESFLDTGLGLLNLLNPFNYPLITLVVAPLTLILTGSLGLTTFFIPWTIFPTLFLSRKAKQSYLSFEEKPILSPDGWFWHAKYKTWSSFNQNKRQESINSKRDKHNNLASFILRLIDEFAKKYNSNINKSWKRRKK